MTYLGLIKELRLQGKMKIESVSCSRVWICDPMDYSLSGSSVHGISQARILEWVAISFFRGSSQNRDGNWQTTDQNLERQANIKRHR